MARATRSSGAASKDTEPKVKKENVKDAAPSAANTSKKRSRSLAKADEPVDFQPKRQRSKAGESKPKGKKTKEEPDFEAGAKLAAGLSDNGPPAIPSDLSDSKPAKSPYPEYSHPTPEECQNVKDVLAEVHGNISAPKTIRAPSLTSSGCGEVPSVLDALVRTRLSAATNNANSSRAFRGLVDRFGTIKQGVGKGSVDWESVRKADVKEVFECIKSGGLADVKSRDIKKILDLVNEENRSAKQGDPAYAPDGVLSLDHLHVATTTDAYEKLLQYPGVGKKTASCVLLFCMQRPSFAVDTHVFRLTRWLGWTPSDAQVRAMGGRAAKQGTKRPPPVTRESTFDHLDVRVPDELKYPLHYLLIQHGKRCPSCMAKKDGKVVEAWGDRKCPLAVLKRGGKVGEARKVAKEEAAELNGAHVKQEKGIVKEEDGETSQEDDED